MRGKASLYQNKFEMHQKHLKPGGKRFHDPAGSACVLGHEVDSDNEVEDASPYEHTYLQESDRLKKELEKLCTSRQELSTGVNSSLESMDPAVSIYFGADLWVESPDQITAGDTLDVICREARALTAKLSFNNQVSCQRFTASVARVLYRSALFKPAHCHCHRLLQTMLITSQMPCYASLLFLLRIRLSLLLCSISATLLRSHTAVCLLI